MIGMHASSLVGVWCLVQEVTCFLWSFMSRRSILSDLQNDREDPTMVERRAGC